MNLLKLLGDWLGGWDAALVPACIATTGRAESIEKGSHVTRTRYAHLFDFIECFTTTFLRAHSWLNWVLCPSSNISKSLCVANGSIQCISRKPSNNSASIVIQLLVQSTDSIIHSSSTGPWP